MEWYWIVAVFIYAVCFVAGGRIVYNEVSHPSYADERESAIFNLQVGFFTSLGAILGPIVVVLYGAGRALQQGSNYLRQFRR